MAQEQNKIAGLLEAGNIDLEHRPVVHNEDGTISTVRSMGVNIDGKEILIPTVSPDGKILSDDEAIKLYEESGKHLGIFDTPEHSTVYAKTLHEDQAKLYSDDAVVVDAPEGVTYPWQMSWGSDSSYEEPKDLSTPMVPWNMEWGTTPDFSSKDFQDFGNAIGQPANFNEVFSRLIQAESRGQHFDEEGNLTTSNAGAQGITQVMPKTGKNPGYGVKPLQNNSEEEFVRFGRDYLQAMVDKFNGDIRKAVAAYNAGPASVDRAISQAAKRGRDWTQYLPKRSETIPYMKKILGEA